MKQYNAKKTCTVNRWKDSHCENRDNNLTSLCEMFRVTKRM